MSARELLREYDEATAKFDAALGKAATVDELKPLRERRYAAALRALHTLRREAGLEEPLQ